MLSGLDRPSSKTWNKNYVRPQNSSLSACASIDLSCENLHGRRNGSAVALDGGMKARPDLIIWHVPTDYFVRDVGYSIAQRLQ